MNSLLLSAEAEADLQRAFNISARRPEAFLYLAKLRLDQDRPAEALQNALQAKKLVAPGDAFESEICECLVRIHACQGNFSEAMIILNGWLSSDPNNEQARKLAQKLATETS